MAESIELSFGLRMSEVERHYIEGTVEFCDGDERRAAESLGISLRKLRDRMDAYRRAGGDLFLTPKPVKLKSPVGDSIAAYCEEYEAHRGTKAFVAGRDARALKEAVELNGLSADEVRAAAKVFFAMDDPWLRSVSYRLSAFVDRIQQCSVRAQLQAKRPIPTRPEPIEGGDFASLSWDSAKARL